MGAEERELEFPDADPLREYNEEELRRLTINLASLYGAIDRGELIDADLTPALLCELHKRIFEGVREFAGRPRGPGAGEPHVVFGPHRSFHRDEVTAALRGLFRDARRSVQSLLDSPTNPDYESAAFHIAVWTQAEVLRIHPFSDGNGRAARALTDVILVRLGFDPVPIEACRQEYIAVLNGYYSRQHDIRPLVDLYVRLATG